MEIKLTATQKILAWLLSPIILIVSLLLLITKGRGMSDSYKIKFTSNFINDFKDELFTFIGIDSFPEININLYRINGNYGEFRIPGFVDVARISCEQVIERTDNTDTYIILYPEMMSSVFAGNNIMIRLMIIFILVHELTHYKQYTMYGNVFTQHLTRKEYLNDVYEIEARKASRKFLFKYFIKIVKYIF